ncbi:MULTISPECIES: hypothetical protein [unclassified Sphingomonas]|uniref:hypothetical protein n=1 Tax=unclassified Sphingomonas TaxID=196159 RepID=UPI0022698BD6|nr:MULTISPECIES: hypothetical protein [unclassified Sphingomonas]
MTGPLTANARDPLQMALWVEMSDMAERYDAATLDLLGGVPMELILALLEAGPALSPQRRVQMLAAGALILRLVNGEARGHNEATARMLARLGLPQ